MKNAFIGSAVERREDLRFLRGRGEYVDDLQPDGLLYAVILRSSVAHGRIKSIDTSEALKIPGVHAVITAQRHAGRAADRADAAAAAAGVQAVRAAGDRPRQGALRRRADGGGAGRQRRHRRGRAGGDRGRDRAAAGGGRLARRAAGQEPAVRDRRHATARSTFNAVKGDADAAFGDAPYVRRETFRTGRHFGLTMEPRGVMAEWDAAKGKLTVSGAAKVPFFNRRILAKQIGLPEDAIEMIENDVGGGFGARGEFYPEDFLIPFAARHVNRPVKWIEDRRENLMAMNHAREAEVDVEIACARDGTILALRGHAHVDMGAYMRTNGAVGARNIAQFMTGPYRIPNVKLDVSLWMTNKTPVGTYRGPGRFETDFFRERLFDIVAQDLGIDRVEFRRKNLIAHAEMPYRIATISPYAHEDELRQRRLPA